MRWLYRRHFASVCSAAKARAEPPETFRDLGCSDRSVPDGRSRLYRGRVTETRERVHGNAGGSSAGDDLVDVNVRIGSDSRGEVQASGGRNELEPSGKVVLQRIDDTAAADRVFARRFADMTGQRPFVDEASEGRL